MIKETFQECPRCKGDACMKTQVSPDIATYHCWGCGFISNTLMQPDQEFYSLQFMHLPELYKDLAFTDETGQVWLPNTVNRETKGMVFANGTNAADWRWTAVPAVERTDEDRANNPQLKAKYKMDMTQQKHFTEKEYMDALTYIGLLP